MPTYYGQIPGTEIKAEIEAPDTRHGRTVFLDYLSRQGFVPWGKRQYIRKQIIMHRMRPGQIPTDIQLDYDQTPELKQAMPIRDEYYNGSVPEFGGTGAIRAVEPPPGMVRAEYERPRPDVYTDYERREPVGATPYMTPEVGAPTVREGFVPRRIRPY